jgi:hypothetical protein
VQEVLSSLLLEFVGKVKIEELFMTGTGDEEKDIEIINFIYNRRLEEAICQNPKQ